MKLEQQCWDPIVAWAESKFNFTLKTATGGVLHIKQSPETRSHIRAYLESLDPWTYTALERAVMTSKSMLLGLALVKREISVDVATRASLLEYIYQRDVWGELADHQTEEAVTRLYLGSCVVFLDSMVRRT